MRSFADLDRQSDIIQSNTKHKKIKSTCLESEPILEELEEYQGQELDPFYHSFFVPPQRARINSVDISFYNP
jgi:hypothetical protein